MKKIHIPLLVFLVLGMGIVKAQTTSIYSFTNNEYPHGSLTLSGNKMYGMTEGGGANGFGYVFAVNKNGTEFKDIWDFNDTGSIAGNSNGAQPYGSLTLLKGKLYGFTFNSGANGYGLIFSIDTNGKGYKDLWDFNSITGDFPKYGALTLLGHKFYGMTYTGGTYNFGVIFSIDTNGSGYTDLFNFNDTLGQEPEFATLLISGNKMYGVTHTGGANKEGVVFSVDTNGKGYTDLLDFNYVNGEYPYGSLVLSGNKLYGMTALGGQGYNDGTIFSIDTSGNEFKDVFVFNSYNGEEPYGALTLSPWGKLYGMTANGGKYLYGALFSIDTSGNNFSNLFWFDAANGGNPDGNSLTVSGDTLFGMTYSGGFVDNGVIFRFEDSTGTGVSGMNAINTDAGNLNIYPNPNNGRFIIESSVVNSQSLVNVYNMLGEKVEQWTMNNGQMTIDMSDKPTGVYLYRVTTDTGSLVGAGKFIIE